MGGKKKSKKSFFLIFFVSMFIISIVVSSQTNVVNLVPDVKDYFMEVNMGNIPGQKLIHKFGFNDNVGTAEVDLTNFGSITWLTNASTLEAISTDTDDDAGGTGVRTIFLEGLDENFSEISETIIMNGTSPTLATSNLYIRLNRAYVINVGTYTGTNEGDVTIRVSGGGATMGFIEGGEGQTQQTLYTVPVGKTAYILRTSITMQTNKEVSINLFRRSNANTISAPFTGKRLMHEWTGVAIPVQEDFKANHKLSEKTDVWMTALVSTGTATVEADYDILLVDN